MAFLTFLTLLLLRGARRAWLRGLMVPQRRHWGQVLEHFRGVFQFANRRIQRLGLTRTAGQLAHGHVGSQDPHMFVTVHQLLQGDLGKALGLFFEQLGEEVLGP